MQHDKCSLAVSCGCGAFKPAVTVPCLCLSFGVGSSHISLQSPESAVRASQTAEGNLYAKGNSGETVRPNRNARVRFTVPLYRKLNVFKLCNIS